FYGENAPLNFPNKKEDYLKLNLKENFLQFKNGGFLTKRNTGTIYRKKFNSWIACVRINNETVHLKYFQLENDAAELVDMYNIFFGIKGYLNFPEKIEDYKKRNLYEIFSKLFPGPRRIRHSLKFMIDVFNKIPESEKVIKPKSMFNLVISNN
ncbi:MAG: hypothetical protein AABY22_23595, partial [Nanoarchaeota archaeon]